MWGPPTSTLFPYTTLFRSGGRGRRAAGRRREPWRPLHDAHARPWGLSTLGGGPGGGQGHVAAVDGLGQARGDRKSTRLNSSHLGISYAVFCLKKKRLMLTGLEDGKVVVQVGVVIVRGGQVECDNMM